MFNEATFREILLPSSGIFLLQKENSVSKNLKTEKNAHKTVTKTISVTCNFHVKSISQQAKNLKSF